MKQNKSGLLIPSHWEKPLKYNHNHSIKEPMPKSWENFLFECSYISDVHRFEKLIEENPNVRFIALLNIPFLNVWGKKVGQTYLIIYTSQEEMSMGVMT